MEPGQRFGDGANQFGRNGVVDAAKILPGEFYFTFKDMVIVTVLSSCVADWILDRVSGIGGMNHFMLPDSDSSGPVSPSARYGDCAMEVLINQLLKAGAVRENLEAKVFGNTLANREQDYASRLQSNKTGGAVDLL